MQMISLKPPTEPSVYDCTESVQPFDSQKRWYILKRSPANNAASSPPVPPRISSTAFFASSGSLGMRSTLIFSSISGMRASQSCNCSRAISFISGSLSVCISSRASSRPDKASTYSLRAWRMCSRSRYSRVNLTYRCWSAMTFGSVTRSETSSNRLFRPSSFSNRLFTSFTYLLSNSIRPSANPSSDCLSHSIEYIHQERFPSCTFPDCRY